ncbi:MAG TPA: DUF1552 domain-containing protein [Marinagarivorans sp.]
MKIRYKNQFDKQRRDLLKTITGAGISRGLLNSFGLAGAMMINRLAEAQTGPKKSFALYVAGGVIPALYTPSSVSAMKPMSQGYLTEGVANDINFLVGAATTNPGHGAMPFRFGGSYYGQASFDVMMARTIGANHPLDVLNLGVSQLDTQSSPTRSDDGSTINTINDPQSAMRRITSALGSGGGGNTGGGGSGGTNPRQLFVDLHRDAIKTLNSKVLGQHEKEKLEQHLTSIETLESKLAPADTGGGAPVQNSVQTCPSVAMPAGNDGDFTSHTELQLEIAALALSCNVTASVSLCLGDDTSGFDIPGFNDKLHTSHHNDTITWGQYITTAGYMFGLAAKTVRKFKDAGLLSDTLIVQNSDMGDGNAHSAPDTPMFMAGAGVRAGQVTPVGGASQMDMFETAARILGADAHPAFKGWGGSPISGVAS